MGQSDFNIGNSGSLILEGTVVKGDIFSDKNVCLKGTLTGNVHCKATFFLPAGAKVEGNVSCADLLSAGLITGDQAAGVCAAAVVLPAVEAVAETADDVAEEEAPDSAAALVVVSAVPPCAVQ